MKKYTEQDIYKTRRNFRLRKFPEFRRVTVGPHRVDFFELPNFLEPLLPHFVFRCTGNSKYNYVLAISKSVPEEHRKYWIAHEYVEFVKDPEHPVRCVHALEAELSLVPEKMKSGYLTLRKEFFAALIPYCKKKLEEETGEYTTADIQEFQKSLNKLEELVNANLRK